MKPQGSGASGIVPYQAFRAADGWIVIGGGNDGLFAKIGEGARPARAWRRPALRDERRARRAPQHTDSFARGGNREVTRSAKCASRMDAQGVPNAPVQRIDQVVHDEHAKALGIIQSGPEGALATVGLPLRFDGVRPAYERAAPKLGQDGSIVESPQAVVGRRPPSARASRQDSPQRARRCTETPRFPPLPPFLSFLCSGCGRQVRHARSGTLGSLLLDRRFQPDSCSV